MKLRNILLPQIISVELRIVTASVADFTAWVKISQAEKMVEDLDRDGGCNGKS